MKLFLYSEVYSLAVFLFACIKIKRYTKINFFQNRMIFKIKSVYIGEGRKNIG